MVCMRERARLLEGLREYRGYVLLWSTARQRGWVLRSDGELWGELRLEWALGRHGVYLYNTSAEDYIYTVGMREFHDTSWWFETLDELGEFATDMEYV